MLFTETPPVEFPASIGANFAVNGAEAPALIVTGALIPLIVYPEPTAEIELIVSGIVPLLEIVTACEELPPTETFPKVIEFGVKLISACAPLPVRATVAGDVGSLLAMVREPVADPVA